MKKRISAMILAIMMVLTLLPVTASAAQGGYWGASGNNVSWSFENGTLTISGEGDMASVDDVWDEDGSYLGTNAPWNDLGVTRIVVEPGVTNVSYSAFAWLSGLETVTLADTVEVIDEMAFEGCDALTTVNLPASLREVGVRAFAGCSALTGPLVIPEGVAAIAEEAFFGCEQLRSVTLPEGLISIGWGAFQGSGLERAIIPASVELIDYAAFARCPNLLSIDVRPENEFYESVDGILYTEGLTDLEQVPACVAGTLTIPDTVTGLWNDAAFDGCIWLEGVVIPASVTEIASGLFASCAGLKSIEVAEGNPVYYDADGVLCGTVLDYVSDEEAAYNALIAYPRAKNTERYTVPEGIEMLELGCFYGCTRLWSVTIPASCAVIYSGVFEGCTNLARIQIDEGNPSYYSDGEGVVFNRDMTVEEYDPDADAFVSVTYPEGTMLCFFPTGRDGYYEIPEGVSTIQSGCFTGSAIEAVSFPASVKTLSYWAMDLCEALTWLRFDGDKPQVLYAALEGVTAEVYYPADNATWAKPEFEEAWGELTYIPYAADQVPQWPGRGPSDPTSGVCGEDLTWVLEDGVLTVSGTGPMFEAVDSWEWQPCAEQITRVVLEEGVTTVGDSAFMLDYANLEHVTLPSTLTAIGDNAFAHAYALTDVLLPEGLSTIGMNAFLRTAVTEAVIPDSVTTLGSGAFSECPALQYVKLPASLEEIVTMSAPFHTGSYLFTGCPALTTVQMPVYDEGFSLGGAAFADCTALTDIDFFTGTVIDEAMFSGCTGLTDITVSASVTQIGASAFEGCTGLKTVTFAGDAPMFSSEKVFYGDTLTAYYPANNATWTEDVMQSYGGDVTWISYAANPFRDVPGDSFYYDPVMWAIEKGITNGLTPDTFGPDAACNRAQVVTFLWRAAGCPEPASDANPFVDVKAADFFYKPVLWAVENGITNGADATHFNPNGICNRAQVVTFLYRAFESPAVERTDNPFADVPADTWYTAPVLWAVEKGITNGLDAAHFGPNTSCNRAQVVTFLYRAYNN